MLDIKYISEHLEAVIENLERRGGDFAYLRQLVAINNERKQILSQVERLKQKRNEMSKEIGRLKQAKQDASQILAEVGRFGEEIKKQDARVAEIDNEIKEILLATPNLMHESVPFGRDDSENKELYKKGEVPKFSFPCKSHYELGAALDILDFERAGKIAGSRFAVYKGLGARLERAVLNLMLDTHAAAGYEEMIPPYIVSRESMTATGQLPKFEDGAFKLANGDGDWFLNPTAEVPTINYYRNETIPFAQLPIRFAAYTMAFRSEAGSAGRDTRGLIRQHQFNKVELIKFTSAEDSYAELDKMLAESTKILDLLKLPYRVVTLCSGDLGFNAAKTYDVEVWIPSQNTYREIASISNDEAYQARRGNITTRRAKGEKLEYVHTLNGSGLPGGRTVAAILENYQNADGSITIPEVLVPYMLGVTKIG